MKYDVIKEALTSNKKTKTNKVLKDVEHDIQKTNKAIQIMYNRILSDETLKTELMNDIENSIGYLEFLESCKKQLENHRFDLYNDIVEHDIYDIKKQLGLE